MEADVPGPQAVAPAGAEVPEFEVELAVVPGRAAYGADIGRVDGELVAHREFTGAGIDLEVTRAVLAPVVDFHSGEIGIGLGIEVNPSAVRVGGGYQ